MQLMPPVFGLLIGTPVESVTVMSTPVPRQTKTRLALNESSAGVTTFPVMKCTTLLFWVWFWPLPIVTTVVDR